MKLRTLQDVALAVTHLADKVDQELAERSSARSDLGARIAQLERHMETILGRKPREPIRVPPIPTELEHLLRRHD